MPRIRGVSILNAPAVAPSIATPAPWVTASTQTGTTTSGSTSVTALSSTANLNVGQPVSGTGIQIGTTIATISSATAIVLSLPATASGSPSLTFSLWDPWNTGQFSGGFGGYSMPMPPPVIGALVEIPNLVTMAATSTYVIPPGDGLCVGVLGATNPATYQVFQGTASPAWATIATFPAAATTTMYYMSDGANFRISNGATANNTFTFYQFA